MVRVLSFEKVEMVEEELKDGMGVTSGGDFGNVRVMIVNAQWSLRQLRCSSAHCHLPVFSLFVLVVFSFDAEVLRDFWRCLAYELKRPPGPLSLSILTCSLHTSC